MPSKESSFDIDLSSDPWWAAVDVDLDCCSPLLLPRNLGGGLGSISSLGGVELFDCRCFEPASFEVPADDDTREMLLAGVMGCSSALTIGMLSTGRVSSMLEDVMMDASFIILDEFLFFVGGLDVGVGGREAVLLVGEVP